MCRIESDGLRKVESAWAVRTAQNSENRLIDIMERYSTQIINRARKKKGLPLAETPTVFSTEKREEIRRNLQQLADAAY
ncbi:MAG: coproporphyrinogen III oxidase-like Fe-S oxidoreductase [Patiriisocius sp.]|jgi:coproporphyrinogen III oxidase-like Fe-S oxidoreductase